MSSGASKLENRQTLKKLVFIAILMFGFGYALVPLYKKICEVTGVYSLTKPDEVVNTQVDESRSIVLEFDANSRNETGWEIIPLENRKTVHPGELVQVTFKLTNPTATTFEAQAIPSYGPKEAGQYVKKLECFCFTQQKIKANETRDFPVVLVIDPELPKDVTTVTLSYTMFEIEVKSTTEKEQVNLRERQS